MNTQIVKEGRCHKSCFSWSAVLVGALVSIGIAFIFNLFAFALGITAFTTTEAGVTAIAVGGLTGIAIITAFSTGIGGWVAGYLGHPRSMHRDMGVLYGFTSWCVALLLMVFLSAHFSKFIELNVATLQAPRYTMNVAIDNNPQTPTASVAVNKEDATKGLILSLGTLFGLAFLGALSASIGGHCGARSCEKDVDRYRDGRLG